MPRKTLFTIMAAGALAAICFIYYRFNPSSCGFFPRCPFYVLTGLLCPGCGSQRVFHSLLHLDFVAAFRLNAYLVFMLPFAALSAFAAAFRLRFNRLYRVVNSRASMVSFAALTVAWWVARNVFGW